MTSGITVKTALCLIPPENFWEQIQAIRSVHDKAYPRWMPHINLIYPFAYESEFENIKTELNGALNRRKPFEIQFDENSFHYFKQKGNECTFHLRPKITKDVAELQQVIEQYLGKYIKTSRPFEAHLTLGQTTTSRISDILIEMKAKWKTIKFTIDRVCMISRENDPNDLFSIKNQVLLIGDGSTQVESSETCSTEQLSTVIHNPIATVTKSAMISSKYLLCIIPSSEFSNRIIHLFEDKSFSPKLPFRIVLTEFDNQNFDESNLRSIITSMKKFTISFGPRSICFNYSSARLFLKPTDIDCLQKFNFNKNTDFDGTLTLGQLDKRDLTEVGDRFTQNWSYAISEIEVTHIHVINSDERILYSFPLTTQSFS